MKMTRTACPVCDEKFEVHSQQKTVRCPVCESLFVPKPVEEPILATLGLDEPVLLSPKISIAALQRQSEYEPSARVTPSTVATKQSKNKSLAIWSIAIFFVVFVMIANFAPVKKTSAEVISVEVVPFVNPAGKRLQSIQTTWKNTGETTIRVVNADIELIGDDGSILDTINYTIHAEFNDSSGVKPGEIFTPSSDQGFLAPDYGNIPGFRPVQSARVTITKALEFADM